MKNDKKFLIGLKLYIIIFIYSVSLGYLYGNYKKYNIIETIIISINFGLLAPFFIPINYIVNKYVKDEYIEPPFIQNTLAPLIVFKYLCSSNKNITPKNFNR